MRYNGIQAYITVYRPIYRYIGLPRKLKLTYVTGNQKGGKTGFESPPNFLPQYFYLFAVHSVVYTITHTNTCIHIYIYIYILFEKSKIYIKTFRTLLHVSITRSSSGSIHCSLLKLYGCAPYAVQRDTRAAQHTAHSRNQAHSEQRTSHTQKHDMLPQY